MYLCLVRTKKIAQAVKFRFKIINSRCRIKYSCDLKDDKTIYLIINLIIKIKPPAPLAILIASNVTSLLISN